MMFTVSISVRPKMLTHSASTVQMKRQEMSARCWIKNSKRNGSPLHRKGVTVLVIGQFPPPLTGLSFVTSSATEAFAQAKKIEMQIVDTSVRNERGMKFHMRRALKILKGVFLMLKMARPGDKLIVYFPFNAGSGVLYNIILARIAGCLGAYCLVHHHSYAYLDRYSWLVAKFASVSDGVATHIVLSEGMAMQLKRLYGIEGSRAAVISNSVFIERPLKSARRHYSSTGPFTIGLLSNLCKEKGLGIFLALLLYCRERSEFARLSGLLAGPIASERDRSDYSVAEKRCGGALKWIGPVTGSRKNDFFDNIDVFVFPTQYSNEAQPLVIYEAMSRGIPVISIERGAISEQVGGGGVVLGKETAFVSSASEVIEELMQDEEHYRRVSLRATEAWRDSVAVSQLKLNKLIDQIVV